MKRKNSLPLLLLLVVSLWLLACEDNNHKPNECVEGNKRCEQNAVELCQNARWNLIEACGEKSCDASNSDDVKCNEIIICTDGQKRCNSGQIETCINNFYTNAEDCPENTVCKDTLDSALCETKACTENSFRCVNNNSLEKCISGTFTLQEDCSGETPVCNPIEGICEALSNNCGNNQIDDNEICDGSNLNNKDCSDFNETKIWLSGGTPACVNCQLTQGTCEELNPPTPIPILMRQDQPMALRISHPGPYAGSFTCEGLAHRIKSMNPTTNSIQSSAFCGSRNRTNLPQNTLVGDIHADGKDDIVLLHREESKLCPNSEIKYEVRSIQDDSSLSSLEACFPKDTIAIPKHQFLADMSGDGRDELVLAGKNTDAAWHSYLTCKSLLVQIIDISGNTLKNKFSCLPIIDADAKVLPTNLNNDTKVDLLLIHKSSSCANITISTAITQDDLSFKVKSMCVDGDPLMLQNPALMSTTNLAHRQHVFMFNYQKSAKELDILHLYFNPKSELKSTPYKIKLSSTDQFIHDPIVGDFNYDDVADLALIFQSEAGGRAQILLSEAANEHKARSLSFDFPSPPPLGSSDTMPRVFSVDADGDQIDDIAWLQPNIDVECPTKFHLVIINHDFSISQKEYCLSENYELVQNGFQIGKFSGNRFEEIIFSGQQWLAPILPQKGFHDFNRAIFSQWSSDLETRISSFKASAAWETYTLYNQQLMIINLFRYIQMTYYYEQNAKYLLDIIAFFKASFEALSEYTDGTMRWRCQVSPHDPNTKCARWNVFIPHYQNQEVYLDSGQWLTLVASTVEFLASMPSSQLTATHIKFVNEAVPVIKSHFFRWHNAVDDILLPYPQPFTERMKLLMDPQYVLTKPMETLGLPEPTLLDKDKFMASIAADLLSAHRNKPSWNVLTAKELEIVTNVVKNMTIALNIRLMTSQYGDPTDTLVFDPFFSDRYEDMKYVGYTGPIEGIPDAPIWQANGAGFDVGHSQRLVQLFIYPYMRVTPFENPNIDIFKTIRGFSTQIVKNILYSTPEGPKFKNYFGGVDGWYRVNYFFGAGTNAGDPPSRLGGNITCGGYGFFALLSPLWKDELQKIYDFIINATGAQVQHARNYLQHKQDIVCRPGFLPLFAQTPTP